MAKNSSETINLFPWRAGNRFELLNDGERFFPAMLKQINEAEHSILLEIYLIKSGRVTEQFFDAFLAAAERGVSIYLLIDDFGSLELEPRDLKRLQHPRITLCRYNPLSTRSQLRALYLVLWKNIGRDLHRTHRKILLVDGKRGFVGGFGLCDEFIDNSSPAWHELAVQIEGELIHDWQQLFYNSWQRYGEPIQLPTLQPEEHPQGKLGRVVASTGQRKNTIRKTLLQHTKLADKQIWLTTAYFAPSWRIRRRLRKAAQRGVDVRLLLPGPITDHPAVRHAGRRFYSKLLRHGVRIFEYQPSVLHAKMVICDHWISIGSSNFDHWGLRWNLEANQEIEDAELARQAMAILEDDFRQSEEYTYIKWSQRNWFSRLQERFWGTIDQLLAKLNHRLK